MSFPKMMLYPAFVHSNNPDSPACDCGEADMLCYGGNEQHSQTCSYFIYSVAEYKSCRADGSDELNEYGL